MHHYCSTNQRRQESNQNHSKMCHLLLPSQKNTWVSCPKEAQGHKTSPGVPGCGRSRQESLQNLGMNVPGLGCLTVQSINKVSPRAGHRFRHNTSPSAPSPGRCRPRVDLWLPVLVNVSTAVMDAGAGKRSPNFRRFLYFFLIFYNSHKTAAD